MAESETNFQQAIRLAPGNVSVWNSLAWVQLMRGNSAAAKTSFEKAVSMQPDDPAALNGLGQIYLQERKFDDAEKYLLRAAPQAPAAWFGLARLYLLEGKFEQAEKWAQDILDSGLADETDKKMLEAAQRKKLSEGLRLAIEPQAQ
jgi:Flp pilus assembly protein TadD